MDHHDGSKEKSDEKLYQLLKMMQQDDIDAEFVEDNLGITRMELESIVNESIKLGFLRYSSVDELELTDKGIDYIKWRNSVF